jgi:hypothetical protein
MRNEKSMTPSRFRELSDVFGADLGRWPAAEREAARAMAAREPAAGRLLAAETAFDRLLGLAPDVPPPPAALLDRMIATAVRGETTRIAGSAGGVAGNVIEMPRNRRAYAGARTASPRAGAGGGTSIDGDGLGSSVASPGVRRFSARRIAGAGGMLAASLLIGIWLGASGIGGTALGIGFGSRATAADVDAMSEIVQTALPLELLEGSDEDSL